MCYTSILLVFTIIFNIICNHTAKILSPNILSSLEPRFINKIGYQDAYQQLKIWDSMKYTKEPLTNISHIISSEEIYSNEGLKALNYLKNRYFASTTKAYEACKLGFVCINGIKIYSTRILKAGDILTIRLPDENTTNIPPTLNPIFVNRLLNFTNSLLDTTNTNPPLHIIYEDKQVAVVFKPAGIHSLKWIGTMKKRYFSMDDLLPLILEPPSNDTTSSNLSTNATISNNKSNTSYLSRPLPCHRLDARVAGCLVVAKTSEALAHLNQQFQYRVIKKEYLAILAGNATKQILELITNNNNNIIDVEKMNTDSMFNIKFPINLKNACTTVKIISTTPCNVYGCLTKGRRHQLRQHCALLGTPIVGDDLYHNVAYHKSIEERLYHIQMLSKDQTIVNDDDNDDDEFNESSIAMNQQQQQQYDTNTASTTITTRKFSNDICLQDNNNPTVRKGVGIFLMAKSIEFQHPDPYYYYSSNNSDSNNISGDDESIIISRLQNNTHYHTIIDEVNNDNNRSSSNKGYFITKRYTEEHKLILNISIAELPKYSQITNKAIKGAKWKENTFK